MKPILEYLYNQKGSIKSNRYYIIFLSHKKGIDLNYDFIHFFNDSLGPDYCIIEEKYIKDFIEIIKKNSAIFIRVYFSKNKSIKEIKKDLNERDIDDCDFDFIYVGWINELKSIL